MSVCGKKKISKGAPRLIRHSGFTFHGIVEAFKVVGPFLGFGKGDDSLFDEDGQVAFKRDHLFFGGVFGFDLHLGINLFNFVFSDEIGDGVIVVENLHHGHAALAVFARNEFLTDNIAQSEGQLVADFLLAAFREKVEDAGDGPDDISGVESGKNQVAGFGSSEGKGDGFSIAHFTDEDDIRVFPHHRAEAVSECVHISADLPLGNHRVFLTEDIFNGVFECDNAAGTVLVDSFDEGGDRGAFAGTGNAGKENQPLRLSDNVFPDIVGETDVFGFGNFGSEGANSDSQAVIVHEGVQAKLKGTVTIGAVHGCIALKGFNIFGSQEGKGQLFDNFLGDNPAFETDQIAVNTIAGLGADFDVEVGDPHCAHFFEISKHVVDAEETAFTGRINFRVRGIEIVFFVHNTSIISLYYCLIG